MPCPGEFSIPMSKAARGRWETAMSITEHMSNARMRSLCSGAICGKGPAWHHV